MHSSPRRGLVSKNKVDDTWGMKADVFLLPQYACTGRHTNMNLHIHAHTYTHMHTHENQVAARCISHLKSHTWEAEAGGSPNFKASLAYMVSWGQLQWKTLSQKQQESKSTSLLIWALKFTLASQRYIKFKSEVWHYKGPSNLRYDIIKDPILKGSSLIKTFLGPFFKLI